MLREYTGILTLVRFQYSSEPCKATRNVVELAGFRVGAEYSSVVTQKHDGVPREEGGSGGEVVHQHAIWADCVDIRRYLASSPSASTTRQASVNCAFLPMRDCSLANLEPTSRQPGLSIHLAPHLRILKFTHDLGSEYALHLRDATTDSCDPVHARECLEKLQELFDGA